ncbi:choice-of-anchor B family protein [candidate division KSB1 bacterium]|nr:choice-of-anchor B family protein [candidate division KSB1 bacterium]NIR68763.1 choice-of-anchor B family protein [candidate division KSB1 bacterium]NIS25579.1 choice-of-anchor B family protein [candidate division KSB1 bacterium]NIT72473.1 choice-of-anchor B family protein [candidate division KSB1 bacterium]NIU26257.1 choice-of-anchor B family protein [candidate division KSB1 bacterium]
MRNLAPLLALLAACVFNACSSDDEDKAPRFELISNLEFEFGLTDVWGYFDESTGKEYAVVGFGLSNQGEGSGIYIVDVTDAQNPVKVAKVSSVPGFDVKVWQNYIYTVNGSSTGDGGIVDISDPTNPEVVGTFPSSHNIFIADNGYMYLEVPGLRILDLNVDPENPRPVWSTGNGGHDATVIGNRLYDFHGFGGTNIYDVSEPSSPELQGSINEPFIQFHHSGWPTEDGQFLFICDELSQTPNADITVWDISNPGNAEFVTGFNDSIATVHNLFVRGDFAFASYYTAGFRIFDISNPRQPKILHEFDTSPQTGEQFNGAFGTFPFTRSGNIYVSDMQTGLYIFSFNENSESSENMMAP